MKIAGSVNVYHMKYVAKKKTHHNTRLSPRDLTLSTSSDLIGYSLVRLINKIKQK